MSHYNYIPKEVCQRALENWGKDRQMLQLFEELSELQKEVIKNMNRRTDNLDEIAEEAADVLIMMDQLLHIYGIADKVQEQAARKVQRLKGVLGMDTTC